MWLRNLASAEADLDRLAVDARLISRRLRHRGGSGSAPPPTLLDRLATAGRAARNASATNGGDGGFVEGLHARHSRAPSPPPECPGRPHIRRTVRFQPATPGDHRITGLLGLSRYLAPKLGGE